MWQRTQYIYIHFTIFQPAPTWSPGNGVVFDNDVEMVVDDNMTAVREAKFEAILILQFIGLEVAEYCSSWEVVSQPVG